MSSPWLFAGSPDRIGADAVSLMEGTTFCVSDPRGDIHDGLREGLFVRDTRLLSRWELLVDEVQPDPLSVHQDAPFCATFLSHVSGATRAGRAQLLVTRDRYVGNGMREDISVRNTAGRPVAVAVRLLLAADFADVFDVKDGTARMPAGVRVSTGSTTLDLSIESGGREYAVSVVADDLAVPDPNGLAWQVTLAAHGAWSTSIEVAARIDGARLPLHHPRGQPVEHAQPALRRTAWRRMVPELVTADESLAQVMIRSIDDLGTLRIFDPDRPDIPVVAAGAPWFMALFGRDSLITSMMLLPVDGGLALGTATLLGLHQGRVENPVTEEEPGRILHELRFGPAGTLRLGAANAYYGSADATPLFVMLLGELHTWLGRDAVTPELVAQADAALDWMTGQGDPDGDGFIEYSRKTPHGLANQGWKDSWDGVNFADGTLARTPIALAEVQSYAYGAYRARAALAEADGEAEVALRWHQRADALRLAFNRSFWLPESGWFAVALDADKRPVDALTSNIGHCLWTGIVDDDKAEQVVRHLVGPDMFTGWGIRTLAASMGAYDPMSYHNGSVWPHDTAICVAGLARYGYLEEAGRVSLGLLDAAAAFGHRLPELFSGFDRGSLPVPVPYPAACSPQAWAAAAPFELVRALLRLAPDAHGLRCDPVLPGRLLPFELNGVRFRHREHRIAVDETGWSLTDEGPAD